MSLLIMRRALPPLSQATRLSNLNSSSSTIARFSSLGTSARHSPVPTTPLREKGGGDIEHSFQPHPFDNPARTFEELEAAKRAVGEHKWKQHSRAWEDWVLQHSVYEKDDVEAVQVFHSKRVTLSDKFASGMVAISRRIFDLVTGYKHSSPEAAREAMIKLGKENASLEDLRKEGFVMDVNQWMIRILFLETIAGVPGMVGGILRHLQSLRLMKRDGGWIGTLLQEAENERMHLMTFLKIKDPNWFFRFIVLGAQGVYYNLFFLLYLMSPKSAHRFVGYLEEEAVLTYTQIVEEIRRGNIPEWGTGPDAQKVPTIAKDYWRLDDNCTMIDLLLAVRADEAGHRFVNHTLANLDPKNDFNPFGVKHATPSMQGTLPGFTRDESLAWTKSVEEEFKSAKAAAKEVMAEAKEAKKAK